jgi:hypothetical protein
MAIDRVYGISPRELEADTTQFAQLLADPARIELAEDGIRTVLVHGREEHVLPRSVRGKSDKVVSRAKARGTGPPPPADFKFEREKRKR